MPATVGIVIACIRIRMQLVIIARYHYMKFSGWSRAGIMITRVLVTK